MKLILLGAPGAGKGTQAEIISERLSVPTISTGNIIRAALKAQTEMGVKAKEFIDKGLLVPDDVVIGIVRDRLKEDDCKNGFILDGFPRTVPQAQALDDMGIEIDKVIDIHVPDEKIVQRLSGRRVCGGCGASYHLLYKKPEKDGVCNLCGAQLVQRTDDREETVLERLKIYHEQTEPLVEYYRKKNKLVVVEGQEEVSDTTALTLKALED
ncbi:MAG: adenylate kinase [Oscillospiraceae bacterium]|nr:adenylate kinase [Oscillospiraceae bacterium]MDD7292703.1 adenylate kinase [Clostridiaceae bacterium]MDY5992272.1 adenylate kinase [Oscillospiraceae bacterium]